jgi:hypothetical protein
MVQTNAPKPVEIIVYHQPEKKRFVIHHLNFQAEMPNIPVHDITVHIRLDDSAPAKLKSVPDGRDVAFEINNGFIEYCLARIETFCMLCLEYME